jgi:tetratricopeptide (TPR) repeat protein
MKDVEAICEAPDVWQGLEDLLQHSLLRLRFDATEQRERLAMLESLREYAVERLGDFGAAGVQTRRRHAERFLHFAEERIARVRTPEEAAALQELEAVLDNARSAMHWCRDAQLHEWQGRLALAIGRFLLRRGSLDEALHYIEWGLEASLELRRRQGDTRGTAETLNNLGALAKDENRLEEARQYYAGALRLEQALHHELGAARALYNLGEVAAAQSDLASAHRLAAAAACLFEKVGSPHKEDATELLQTVGVEPVDPSDEHLQDKNLDALVAWALHETDNG